MKDVRKMKPDLEIRLRTYRPSDESRLRELTVAAFDGVSIDQNFDRLAGWTGLPDWRSRKWTSSVDVLRGWPDDAFVAEADARVLGYVSCTLSQETRIGRIVDLVVDEDYRRQGIGSRLIEKALANFRTKGMAMAKIETLDQNHAGRTLYPKFGFQEVANQIHYMMKLDRKP